jgi:ribonuclease HI
MPAWYHTLTVDASYHADANVTGIGIVIQERVNERGRGPILEEIAEAHLGVGPTDCEALAILRALQIARQRGFVRVKVRSDCNPLRRSIRERHRGGDSRGGGNVQEEILRLAEAFEYVDFGYVPRRRNQMAHRLARQGRFLQASPGQRAGRYEPAPNKGLQADEALPPSSVGRRS